MKYRKKPVVIEATQWFTNGDHPQDESVPITSMVETFLSEGKVVRYYRHPKDDGLIPCSKCGSLMKDHGWIDTLEYGHNVCPGDWIITGIKGEKYPIKDEIFRMTYEAVESV